MDTPDNDPEELAVFVAQLARRHWTQSESVHTAFTKVFSEPLEQAIETAKQDLRSVAVTADVTVPYVLLPSESQPITGTASSKG
jgi:hypothetical protein